ncbi:MAG: YkvA family protein, partial [Planctomycetota bacterium]
VASLPEMVEAAVGAAERAGVVDQIRPLLTAALQYVDEEVDFIPDHLGVVGLLDDAYVVRGLLIEMSHRHRALTGESLVDHNRAAQDQRIRRLIGEPTATRLDIAIVAFARSHNIRETVETVVRKVGGAGMAMQLPVAVAFGGGESIDELPNLELGALGA